MEFDKLAGLELWVLQALPKLKSLQGDFFLELINLEICMRFKNYEE